MKIKTNGNKQTCKVGCVIAHLAALAWMVVIFCFTAQNGDESGNLSSGVTEFVMTILNQLFQLGWDDAKLLEMISLWDYPIRKLAHMTEFGILAVLIFHAMKYYPCISSSKKRYLFAWFGAVAYAATDEFHQLFVPGRSGNLFDVCVDASGALLALVLLYVARTLYSKLRNEVFYARTRQL